MEFYSPVSNLLVQVEPATAFFPAVAHWLVFPTPLLMWSITHNGSIGYILRGCGTVKEQVGATDGGRRSTVPYHLQ